MIYEYKFIEDFFSELLYDDIKRRKERYYAEQFLVDDSDMFILDENGGNIYG